MTAVLGGVYTLSCVRVGGFMGGGRGSFLAFLFCRKAAGSSHSLASPAGHPSGPDAQQIASRAPAGFFSFLRFDRTQSPPLPFVLNSQVIFPDQMRKGFTSLVESLDDLLLDVPDAVELLALFICR